MDCYASNCPFRVNRFNGSHWCECTACPNRTTSTTVRTTNRTLTSTELRQLEGTSTKNFNYGDYQGGVK